MKYPVPTSMRTVSTGVVSPGTYSELVIGTSMRVPERSRHPVCQQVLLQAALIPGGAECCRRTLFRFLQLLERVLRDNELVAGHLELLVG